MSVFYRVSSADVIEVLRDLALAHPLEYRMVDAGGGFGVWLVEVTTDYELRKLTASWTRIPTSGVPQDAAQCTFHFLNLTGGVPDATWTDADYTTVETAFDTYWNALKGAYFPETKLAELAWRADGPDFRPFGASLSPTLRIVARSVAGTATTGTMLPPQCALSVTEVTESTFLAYGVGVPGSTPGTGRTQLRNRWGRFYLPAIASGVTTDGRVGTAYCDAVSGATQTFYNTCVAADLIPVVYSPTNGHAYSVIEVHVDDIFDVIRSRRFETPLTRSPRTIDAP